jgi:hypothetical protein
MLYEQLPRHPELREAGWHSRGYLAHFDGREIPQFITLRLADSVPNAVLMKWKRELNLATAKADQITLQRRIERYWIRDMATLGLSINQLRAWWKTISRVSMAPRSGYGLGL